MSASAAVTTVQSIRVISPANPAPLPLASPASLPDITVLTVPPGQAIATRIFGDLDGTLVANSATTFTYSRGSNAAAHVILYFSLQSNPSVGAALDVIGT